MMFMTTLLCAAILLLSVPSAWGQTPLGPGTYSLPPEATIVVPSPEPPPVTQYTLSVTTTGTGTGTVTGAGTYPAGTQVTPGAAAAADSTFTGWSLPIPITMDGDTTVTATFTLIPPVPPASTEDLSNAMAISDGAGGYLVTRVRGSDYAGYSTELIVGKASPLDPATVTDTAVLAIPDNQEDQVVVAGPPGSFLLLWQDLRNGVDYDVYAARVTSAGAVLDPTGILIAGGPNNQVNPTAVWDGTQYVIAWAAFDGVKKYDIKSTDLSAVGVVSAPRMEVTVATEHALRPYLMRASDSVWLFWTEARTATRYMARKLATGETVTLASTIFPRRPQYADNGRYVIFTQPLLQGKFYDPYDIVGLIFDTQTKAIVTLDPAVTTLWATPSGPVPGVMWLFNGQPTSANTRQVSVAWDGTYFWAAWSTATIKNFKASRYQIWIRRVDAATGSFLGEVPRLVVDGVAPVLNPRLVSDQQGQIVLYYDAEDAAQGNRRIVKGVQL